MTSWDASAYDTGLFRSWLVEGLSRRPASGPGSNIWSTIPAQMVTAADMQRFLFGEIGAENGALQVTAGSGMRAAPAIQVRADGAYHPVLFVDALVDTYPDMWTDTRQISRADGLDVEFLSEQGEVLFTRQVALEASSALVSHSIQGGSGAEGRWTINLWPAYNVPWREVQVEGNQVSLAVEYRNTTVEVTIEVLEGEVTYLPRDDRFDLPTVEMSGVSPPSFRFRVLRPEHDAHEVRLFDEASIVSRYEIRDVLIWNETGWHARFESSGCFIRQASTISLTWYSLTNPACLE